MKRAPLDYVDHDMTPDERRSEDWDRDMFAPVPSPAPDRGLLVVALLLGALVLLGSLGLAKIVGVF